ncbi:MAG: rod shape-determining protein MreC [Actinomycetes bacterium]
MRDDRRTRTILGLLLLTALTLVVLSIRGGGEGARTGAQTIFGPIQSAAAAVVRPIHDFVTSIGSLGSKDAQIADLQHRNDDLVSQLRTSEYARNRAKELDDLLRVSSEGQYRFVPAQVIAFGPAQGFAWAITIDAGTADGIKIDQNVINGQGLVGRVVRVTSSTATVALLVDATATVGARIESTMEVGLLNGTGDSLSMEFQLLDPFAPVVVGQRLVSYGTSGGTFVPGIPLGTVTAVTGTPGQLNRMATVAPFVDVSNLDVVGVITERPRVNPRDSILAPASKAPTAGASASPSAPSAPSATPTAPAPFSSPTPGDGATPNPKAS